VQWSGRGFIGELLDSCGDPSPGLRTIGDQWTFWPMEPDLERRLRPVLETRFDELFAASPEGFVPRFITPGREILITWEPVAQSRVG
jgi:hypothetical protein